MPAERIHELILFLVYVQLIWIANCVGHRQSTFYHMFESADFFKIISQSIDRGFSSIFRNSKVRILLLLIYPYIL